MPAPQRLDIELAEDEVPVRLPTKAANLDAVHIFDAESVYAVNASLASQRPLLVRGEPGVGKSQLAQAAAKVLERVFLPYSVDIQTESQDLLWRFDSVSRLAEAQIAGAFTLDPGSHPQQALQKQREAMRTDMAIARFLHPGPLWWAFDWKSAETQAKKSRGPIPPRGEAADPTNGCVLLIDEIDKAETDVPNGLLEALGAGQFTPFGQMEPVFAGKPLPLVIITTNEERALPDAFLRRCMVLNLELPPDDAALTKLLTKRGAQHFPRVAEDVLQNAATQLSKDRKNAARQGIRPLPGQAEYMDLLRALDNLHPEDSERQNDLLKKISKFALSKHRKSS